MQNCKQKQSRDHRAPEIECDPGIQYAINKQVWYKNELIKAQWGQMEHYISSIQLVGLYQDEGSIRTLEK